MQNKGPAERSTLCVNGWLSLSRRRYHSRHAGTMTPSDDLLDATGDLISLGTRQLCCQLNRGAHSFEMATQNLLEAARLSLSAEKLRQVVEAEGRAVLALSHGGDLQPVWNASQCQTVSGKTRVYMSSDGFMAPTITEQEKRARRKKVLEQRKQRNGKKRRLPAVKRGTDGRYKEFKLVMFYDQDLTRKQVSVTRRGCAQAGKLMIRDAWRLGIAAADERLANIDGGPWIINQIRRYQRRLNPTAIGLDFFHLGENVHSTRRILFGEQNEQGQRVADDLLHTVKHEGYQPFREKLLILRQQKRGAKRKEADRLIDYVSDRREMIRYPEFIKKGWQIGSGPMESQCRVTPDRVKGPGKRWDMDHAEEIMALEAMYQSGQCQTYWKLAMSGKN
jgi:hypothetical protein